MDKSSFGIIGMGVMGKNLALNLLDKGYTLSVFNRPEEENLVHDFLSDYEHKSLQGFTELKPFVNSLEKPRKLLVMVKAGHAVDSVINALIPLLSEEDTIIDGGNSYFIDTNHRSEKLTKKGIHFLGCGISGGEEGARNGPSVMPGGSREGYQQVASILESMAATDKNGNPCCEYLGPDGSGHFVKMIHNGIEYAEMQLLAEVYHLLSLSHGNDGIANVISPWNKGELSSYLLEITIDILRKRHNDDYLLDLILDSAGHKGTGSWSSKVALELGTPTTVMTDAVFTRYISSLKDLRSEIGHVTSHPELNIPNGELKKAYQFARLINHIQGFDLLHKTSEQYDWNLNLSSIARIWTSGCIIRSELMEQLIEPLKSSESLLTMAEITDQLKSAVPAIGQILTLGIENQIPLPALSSSYQFWLGITTSKLPANLIQAQRDYFGSHMYQRVDKDESSFFHTNWNE